ncbi:MAG: hypothetical protein WDA18_09675 [Candidatus Ratteibacteria bacterium]
MEKKNHFFRDSSGCPVHQYGYSEEERECSCSIYWGEEDKVSTKAWEDHTRRECAEHGGECKKYFVKKS